MSDRRTSEIAVKNRMNIPLFRPGKESGPNIFSSGDMNVLVRALRALVNPRVVWGERDDVQITDGNYLIQLSRSSGSDGGAKVDQYILTDASNGDYFICRTLSAAINVEDPEDPFVENTIGATDIYIAKPFHLRQSQFDRDVLNENDPGNIGTVDEKFYQISVESWNGSVLSTATRKLSHNYKSATFRIVTNATDANPVNWTTENQTIIPRFVPAVLVGSEPITTTTISPTIIYAVNCSGLGVSYLDDDDNNVDITLLAINDGWAWAKTFS